MYAILKYVYMGLSLVLLGFEGVGVLFYYLVKKLLEPGKMLEVETDDWGDVQSECTRDSSLRSECQSGGNRIRFNGGKVTGGG